MTDRLAGFFSQYSFNARMFFSGTLCNKVDFDESMGGGFLHIVRSGSMKVYASHHNTISIEEPSLIFYPSPAKHQFVFHKNVDLTCGVVDLGEIANNLLIKALPSIIVIPLKNIPTLASTIHLLLTEADQIKCGHQAATTRLFEYLIIQLLRFILDSNLTSVGLIAGLNDKRLVRVISAMHDEPIKNWTLELLAKQAGMSRARFAVHFRETVGTTPMGYLTQWRIELAKTLIKKGKSISLVANEVGYSNASVFSRAFKAQAGLTPKAWLNQLAQNQ